MDFLQKYTFFVHLLSRIIDKEIDRIKRVLNDLQRARLSCRRMTCLLPHHLPLSRQQVVSLSQPSCVSPLELAGGSGGGGGG